MKSAVVLINLGTPEQPTPAAIRKFLRRFLSDRRVVEVPRPLWWLILNLFILPLRPIRLRDRYRGIWIDGQSPLNLYTSRLAMALGEQLDARADGAAPAVRMAMTYSAPDIEQCIDELLSTGVDRMLFVPLYPQFSATTTAAALDRISAKMATLRNIPQWAWVRDYHDHPLYIAALAESVTDFRRRNGCGEALVMSYHGIPKRNCELGDPYQQQCEQTSFALAQQLGLQSDQWQIAYQSRLGRAEWLGPYTRDVLLALAGEGCQIVDVICPSFAVDCLETLEEIAVELAEEFVAAGGSALRFIPCLNDTDTHVQLLNSLVTDARF